MSTVDRRYAKYRGSGADSCKRMGADLSRGAIQVWRIFKVPSTSLELVCRHVVSYQSADVDERQRTQHRCKEVAVSPNGGRVAPQGSGMRSC